MLALLFAPLYRDDAVGLLFRSSRRTSIRCQAGPIFPSSPLPLSSSCVRVAFFEIFAIDLMALDTFALWRKRRQDIPLPSYEMFLISLSCPLFLYIRRGFAFLSLYFFDFLRSGMRTIEILVP